MAAQAHGATQAHQQRLGLLRHSRLNSATGWLLAGIVVLSAVPAASNRPVFWMGWAALILVLASVYLILSARFSPDRGLRFWGQTTLLVPMAVVPLWAVVQAVPALGPWAGALPLPQALQPDTISLAPQASLIGALRITCYVVFFALVLEVANRTNRAERLAWAVFIGVALHTLYGMVALHFLGDQFFWGEKTAYRGFATGTFINRNAFASFIGMGMCLGLGLSLHRAQARGAQGQGRGRHDPDLLARRAEGLGMAVLLILMGITLIMTGSRMGTLASGVGLSVVYTAMALKDGVRLHKILLRMTAIVALTLVVILPIYGLEFTWRVIFSLTDVSYRTTIYATAVQMIAERPLLGYGLDAFEPAYEIFRGPDAVPQLITEYAHSSYLGNWLELGVIVGSMPLVAVTLAMLRLIRMIARADTDATLPIVALGAACLLAVHATVDFSFEMQANVFLLLFLLALGLASGVKRDADAS